MDKFYWYELYGKTLCSQIEYPHLLATDLREAQISIELADIKRKIEDETGCFVDDITKERIYFCNQVGTFQIRNGNKIELCPNRGVSLEQLTPFVFGYGMAMLFWQLDMVAIHCSAVEYQGKALLIAGNSGSGKSTLTTTLLEHGCRLKTDDVAILDVTNPEAIWVFSAFPQQKLCRDAAVRNLYDTKELLYIDEDRDKFAIPRRDKFCKERSLLKGIVFLTVQKEDKDVHFEKLRGHDKLIAYLENNFLFPMFRESNVFTPYDMQSAFQVVQNVPMYRILRPNGVDSTREQMKYIMDNILAVGEEA